MFFAYGHTPLGLSCSKIASVASTIGRFCYYCLLPDGYLRLMAVKIRLVFYIIKCYICITKQNSCDMENWVTVRGFDDYEVSDLGNLRKKELRRPLKNGGIGFSREKVMKPNITSRGYCQVSIMRNKQRYCKLIHRLVYESFNEIEDLGTKYSIDHINGDKLDNRLCNLRYVTHRENVASYWAGKRSIPSGVYESSNGKYVARANVNGKNRHIGYFDNPLDAHNAYKEYISKLY